LLINKEEITEICKKNHVIHLNCQRCGKAIKDTAVVSHDDGVNVWGQSYDRVTYFCSDECESLFLADYVRHLIEDSKPAKYRHGQRHLSDFLEVSN